MRSRATAAAGLVGGLAALGGLIASTSIGASAKTEDFADSATFLPALLDSKAMVPVFQALMTIAGLALLVFAAGLRRHLAEQEPAGSLSPTIAGAGLGLVAAMCTVGAGIATELFWGLSKPDELDPDAAESMYHLVATMSWVWAGAGLTAAVVAISALRHGTLSRWIGWVSAVSAVLILAVSLAPVQYISGMIGALWLVTVAVGLLLARRRVA